jgi:hypothetical protein
MSPGCQGGGQGTNRYITFVSRDQEKEERTASECVVRIVISLDGSGEVE